MKFLILIIFSFSFNFLFSQAPDSNLVLIEGGKFKMGYRHGEIDEKPVHIVKLDDFYLSKYETTNGQFCDFLNSEGNQVENNAFWILLSGKWREEKCRIYIEDSIFKVEEGFENYPVTFVSWYGANAYCKWKGGRLPTEAEWEYSAKGGKSRNEITLLNIKESANFNLNSNKKINKVGSLKPNSLEIYDLYGNLTEWTNDWYSEKYYKHSERNNPKGPEKSDMKSTRGGSWYNSSESLTPSNRRAASPNLNNITIGFRIVYSVDEKQSVKK